jgi:dTDP-4-dehydrorhamnose reductase
VRVLLLGRRGQVGGELERLLAPVIDLVALDSTELDLAKPQAVVERVREVRPQAIVNAAAYTAVDRAESEPLLAAAVNAMAPGMLAEEARRLGAYLVHYSTDYVFDGRKRSPYVETDTPAPLSVYGRTKLQGELAVRAAGGRHAILRSGWIYGERGRNFVLTILGKARDAPRLRVVHDQRGAPTWARDLAQLSAALILRDQPPEGTFHAAAAGETTWCDYAREILRLAGIAVPVEPIASAEYPAAAPRPAYSVLDSTLLARSVGIVPIGPWQERLEVMMRTIRGKQ